MYDVKSQKILGSFDPVDGFWSIPYEFDSDDVNVLNHRGRLYIVVDFEASPNIDLHLASKIIIDEVKEKYYGDTDGTPLQAIEKALISGKEKLKEIAKGDESAVKSLSFNIVCAVVWGKVLYVAQVGETAALLVRNGEVLDIGHKTSGEVLTSSGILESDDVFIISTKKFNESFNNDLLVGKLGSLEEEFKKSESPASLSSVIVMFKKSIIPGKKDIVGIVSSLSQNKSAEKIMVDVESSNNREESDQEPDSFETIEDTEPDQELSAITSLTDIPSSANKDTGVSSVLVDIEKIDAKANKRPKKKISGRAIKASAVVLVLTALVTGSYLFIAKGTPFKFGDSTIATLDIDEVSNSLDQLETIGADKNEYLALLDKVNREIEKGNGDDDLTALKSRIEAFLNKYEIEAKEDNLIFNFSDKADESHINELSELDGALLVSDAKAGRGYLLTDGEEIEIIDLEKKENYLTSFASDGSMYVLTSKAVFIGTSVENLEEFELSDEITGFKDAVEYFGNLYVLADKIIYKFVESEGIYTRSIWSELDNDYKSLTIDGSIYLIGDNGFEEYYTGEKQEFSSSLKSGNSLYTTTELDYIWALSGGNLYKVDKSTGEELSSQSLNTDADNFVVVGSTLYLSKDSKLYKMGLEE